MKKSTDTLLQEFFERHGHIEFLRGAVETSTKLIAGIKSPNKVMICGSGGSAADAAHIVGELMKNFKIPRAADEKFSAEYKKLYGDGMEMRLNGAIPAVSLMGEISLVTAVINDNGADMMFAQQVYGLGFKGDMLIGISTSGNSELVINAVKTAKTLGIKSIAMTGKTGGKLKDYADVLINVPETETYKIQELHLPIYHLLCAGAENERWGK